MQYYQMTGFMGITDEPAEAVGDFRLPDPDQSALYLDFDGTLVEIAERPDDIDVNPAMTNILARAMDRLDGRVVLVSGRSVATLQKFLPDFKGALIGTHGAEMYIDGVYSKLAEFDEDMVRRLCRLADDFAKLRPSFLVEHKPSGVVLHYRQAEECGALALRFMESLAMAADGFRLQPALMAYELKPECVGKDTALTRLMERLPFRGKTPIYAGDDLTDEPALQLVEHRKGYAIKIGEAETVASHRLPDPKSLLLKLEEWLV